MSNVLNTTRQLLRLLKVRYTNTYLKETILSHQDHNSLLAISDTLTKYNIENTAIKIERERFDELPTPCIVQIVNGMTLFYVLERINKNIVSYYNDKNELQNDSKENFLKTWTGISLLAEKNENSKEVNIEKTLATKRVQTILLSTASMLLLTWLVFSFSKVEYITNLSFTIYTIVYTLLKFTGLTIGIFLLWFEIDQYNPSLQKFCSGGKIVNCNAVLQSKHAKLFNGNLSLSIVGFSYFFGSLLFLVISKFSISTLSLLSWLSFMTFPVILISGYYQALIIKQWCKFCIIVQVVLLTEIGIAFFGNFYNVDVTFYEVSLLLALFLAPIIAWKYLKPLLEQKEEINIYKRGLKKIKNNPIVLKSLLEKSHKISTTTEGLGITIKKEQAKYTVIKVCNPYCGPCATAHPILETLVKNNKINLQILFTASTNKNDYKAKPVRHFLAIDGQHDSLKTQQALDEWYKAEKKDYDSFAIKYPLNGELKQQDKKIEAMRNWCDAEKITHTPTIFINGYKLPEEYSIEDLKEVLN